MPESFTLSFLFNLIDLRQTLSTHVTLCNLTEINYDEEQAGHDKIYYFHIK